MSPTAVAVDPIALAVREGLTARHKTLPPWLFYDETGSGLFEQITALPEYYLTRTERALLELHSTEILEQIISAVTVAELGAGTAAKTGILLRAAAESQEAVLYQPIDISPSALEEAARLEALIPGLTVSAQVANYISESYRVERPADHSVLALYIGSSIGNFSPQEAHGILARLRGQLRPGDHLLLGTDLAPGKAKPVARLLAAYDDAQGVTAAFNRNMLTRLNRDLGTDFDVNAFAHRARWNAAESRIEMHLEATRAQIVTLPANAAGPELRVSFRAGETIHTENSYKFTEQSVTALVSDAGFAPVRTFTDEERLFAVTLAQAS